LSKRIQADLALVLVTFIWGTTFILVKDALNDVAPFTFLAMRFGLATVLLAAVCPLKLLRNGRKALGPGFVVGCSLFAGYAFQTVGLMYTSASHAAFVTSLSVVIVPVMAALAFGQPSSRGAWAGVCFAVVGLALLTLDEGLAPNKGDVLVLFCAISFALQIILVGRYTRSTDPVALATVQIATVSLLSLIAAVALDPVPAPPTAKVWTALVITGAFATSFALLVQATVQRFTTATHTGLIMSLEPAFAAVFNYVYAGEALAPRAMFGGALILAGMILAELSPRARTAESREPAYGKANPPPARGD